MIQFIKFSASVHQTQESSICSLTFSICEADILNDFKKGQLMNKEDEYLLDTMVRTLYVNTFDVKGYISFDSCDIYYNGHKWNIFSSAEMYDMFQKYMKIKGNSEVTEFVRYQVKDVHNATSLINNYLNEIMLELIPHGCQRVTTNETFESKIKHVNKICFSSNDYEKATILLTKKYACELMYAIENSN